MPSVTDESRARDRAVVLAMPVAERMALALALGDEAVAMYARVHRVSSAEAFLRLSRQRQRGRGVSGVTGPRPLPHP